PVGTSLICIQGQWSNLVDGHLKGGLAALATAGAADSTYNPLHAFAPAAPKPWGITALFAEYTGNHSPLEIEWPEARAVRSPWVSTPAPSKPERVEIRQPLRAVGHSPARRAAPLEVVDQRPAEATRDGSGTPAQARSFLTLWEFALALNRKDADALAVAADGTTC